MEIYAKFGFEASPIFEQKGLEGYHQLSAFEHYVEVPFNTEQGQLAGNRQHNAVVLTKDLDKASPLLRENMVRGQPIEEILIQFYQPNQKHYYTITLNDARIVSARNWIPNILMPGNGPIGEMEDIGIIYTKITWTFVEGNVSFVDNWYEPVLT
jgi:type VI secretion system secreted protein Hcp